MQARQADQLPLLDAVHAAHTHTQKSLILLNAIGAERRANPLPTGFQMAEPGLQPCGWIPLKAKRARDMYAPHCP